MKNWKSIKKFIITFILSMLLFELVEILISYLFGVDIDNLYWGWLGWLGFIIMYGFKFHIICCLIPFLIASYKCKHSKCKHEYCNEK